MPWEMCPIRNFVHLSNICIVLFIIFQIVLAMIFPPFIAFGLEILNLGETQMSAFQKMGVFYSSPLSKFAHGMVSMVLISQDTDISK